MTASRDMDAKTGLARGHHSCQANSEESPLAQKSYDRWGRLLLREVEAEEQYPRECFLVSWTQGYYHE